MTVETPAGPHVADVPLLTQLSLRVDPAGPATAAVERALGCPLPAPCAATGSGRVEVLWLGPDEFLVLAPPDARADLAERLRTAVGRHFASVVDVSAQRTALELTGVAARDVLARGCAIDLDPRVSPGGTCVQTLLARTGVILLVRDAASVLLLVRASFAAYLAAWLTDACAEFRDRAPLPGG